MQPRLSFFNLSKIVSLHLNSLKGLIIIRIFGSNLGVRGKDRGMFVQGKTRYYVSKFLVP